MRISVYLVAPFRAWLQLCALWDAGPELGAGGRHAQKKVRRNSYLVQPKTGERAGVVLEERWQVDVHWSTLVRSEMYTGQHFFIQVVAATWEGSISPSFDNTSF